MIYYIFYIGFIISIFIIIFHSGQLRSHINVPALEDVTARIMCHVISQRKIETVANIAGTINAPAMHLIKYENKEYDKSITTEARKSVIKT